MNSVILYGSHYGSARRYAQALAESTGIVAVPYTDAPRLSDKHAIVYVGALYAGGVLGLQDLSGLCSQRRPNHPHRHRGPGRSNRRGKPRQHPRFP